jgi:23S rRNA U2552 (ribose-2'-O)-methylase RlmE/FtsJ
LIGKNIVYFFAKDGLAMSHLEKYFYQNKGRLIDKWMHYFEVYEKHFSRFRNKDLVILEIGVFQGGSLQLWKDYFGEGATIYGVDINPQCKELEEKNIKIFIGSQSDRSFLRDLKSKIPPIDILIDDGGHTMEQQIVTFEELFDHVKSDGVYLCEDVHTSYWYRYGGGYKRRGTFIEYSKNFIDYINAWHSKQRSLRVNDFTKSVFSLHYYDSMVVIEKRKMDKPVRRTSGNASFENKDEPTSKIRKFQRQLHNYLNKGLMYLRLPNI